MDRFGKITNNVVKIQNKFYEQAGYSLNEETPSTWDEFHKLDEIVNDGKTRVLVTLKVGVAEEFEVTFLQYDEEDRDVKKIVKYLTADNFYSASEEILEKEFNV